MQQMLLLLQKGHPKPNMVTAPDAGWMASSVVACCWLSAVACSSFFVVSSCFSLSFQPLLPSVFSFLLFFYFISFVTANGVVRWIAYFGFLPAGSLRFLSAWPNHLAASATCIYLCLVVCDHRARLSTYEAPIHTYARPSRRRNTRAPKRRSGNGGSCSLGQWYGKTKGD